MPVVHLVCGPPGAGKTTYARMVAERRGGVCLSMSEWMERLFSADASGPASPGWTRERAARCETQMWALADRLIALDIDVVFDVGLSQQIDRDRFRTRVAQTRAMHKLHYLDVERDTRRARVLARANGGGASAEQALEKELDMLDRRFEPPTDDELYEAMIVCE